MARRGSFGLQPRVAPNVSGQIIALAREYVAKRDALIMDAWRNGGKFEGKKVTDDMVLAYWRERQSGLDKGDPDYESASNQIMQLQYGIEQSKADVLHAQGKMSDSAYAQFFLRWAQKVPKNSEFYRTLQKDAAQLIEQGKAKAQANSERIKTEQFNNFVKTTQTQDIAIGDAMTAALDSLSKQTGLSVTGNGDELLAMLTTNVKANPEQYKQLLDTIKAGDPHWDGQLTEGYFSQHIQSAVQGYEKIADKAQKGGFVSAYANATQGMASMSMWGQNIKAWPVANTYTTAMNSFNKVWNDSNASQMDKTAAAAATAAQLNAMASTPGLDPGTKTMIEADAKRLLGQDAGDSPSFGSSMLGRNGVDPNLAMQVGAWVKTQTEMQANPTAWAYAPVDKNGNYDPTGQGALGMVPAGAVQPGAVGVMVPGHDGKAVLAMVTPHAIYTVDPNNPNAAPSLAGYQINYNVGGRAIQLWGYKDATTAGGNHWTLTSPLADNVSTTVDNKGDIYVTPQPIPLDQQIAGLKNADGSPIQLTPEQRDSILNGGSIKQLVGNTSSKDKAGVKTSITLTVKGGYITSTTTTDQIDATGTVTGSTTNPVQLAGTQTSAAFSPSVLAAGNVPGVTFASPLESSVHAATYTQTQDQVSKFASDPAFQQAFLSQTMQTLGTDNPYDPRIADAWKGVTTPLSGTYDYRGRGTGFAAARKDLNYPGQQVPEANQGKLNVNFGGQTLTIPGVPSYLNGQSSIPGNWTKPGDLGTFYGVKPGGANPNLIPGLGVPPQMATGSPAPSVAPTPTPTPTPTSTVPTPTPAPTATAAPTPSPTPIGGNKTKLL